MRKRKKEEPSTLSRSIFLTAEERELDTGRPYISTGQAAQIMGVSRWTVERRRKRWGFFNIRHSLLGAGRWAFDMEDVIRASYPSANDAEVTMMMKEYRQKFAKARRHRTSADHYASDFISKLKSVFQAGGGNVVIYRKTDTQENPSLVAEITLAQALEGRIRLEGALLDELLDGAYTVSIHGKDKEVLGQYEFSVGTSPEADTGKVDDVSRDPRQAGRDSRKEVKEMMEFMFQYYRDRDDEDEDDEEDGEDDAVYDE